MARKVKRSKTSTQAQINRRMREVWIDGFGMLPYSDDEADVIKLRTDLKQLVHDGAYWNGLIALRQLKKKAHDLCESLKREGFQLED